jgi:predicted ATPase
LFRLGALATLSQPMRIEGIRLRNFRAFRDVDLLDLPSFAVFVGANGTGKTTLFSLFQFLHEALTTNVTTAFAKLGGFQEVRSRGSAGPIEIELTLTEELEHEQPSRICYALQLDEYLGTISVAHETLDHRQGDDEQPLRLLDFRNGEGVAFATVPEATSEDGPRDERQALKGRDHLALKGLAQFKRFPIASAVGTLIERWHLSDLHIDRSRADQVAGDAEHLSSDGDNLPLVLQHLQKRRPDVLAQIVQRLARRVPGLQRVETKATEEGRVLLKFQDGAFEAPFLARHVSDGTITMLAYLVLLLDPNPHPLLCVEEPEHHLYPTLLSELAEELRAYAVRGGQVMVTSHSPDFLNAIELEEVFWLVKRNGATEIRRGRDNAQLKAYMEDGDKLGYLWKQGLFDDVDPK